MQTDLRWKNKDYSAKGEKTTIGKSGCGPTSAAMLIESITGKKFTPVDACQWSLSHHFKAVNQGTYYSYFVPQFDYFNIKCWRLNTANIYGDKKSIYHNKMREEIQKGNYIIACMGKGLWTSSGHYIVVWWVDDKKVYINDPASTRKERIEGDWNTFISQVKYYWVVEPNGDFGEVRYYKVSDIKNATYKQTIQKLINRKFLTGKGGTGENMIIDLSEDCVRLLVILDRAGQFD